jgi:hypothetical protein
VAGIAAGAELTVSILRLRAPGMSDFNNYFWPADDTGVNLS